MAKDKSVFVCQSCGAQAAKWIGKCPSCGAWNSYVEEIIKSESKGGLSKFKRDAPVPKLLSEIEMQSVRRISTGDAELDRVLGGGIVPGSLILIGGEPGIGKSTLLLQVATQLSYKKILYISGEESPQQIKMRADRIGKVQGDIFIYSETSMSLILDQLNESKPDILIVDSIQTLHSHAMESAPGSVSQVRECTHELMNWAKASQTPVFLIGHITKEGSLAGPKVLEHMVDTVLQFEGDRHLSYRILRTQKNRFGSTSELGIYEMRGEGLRQVSNPSEILLSQRDGSQSGVAIGATIEGNRPLLIEVQALVSPANYGTPQRSATGYDAKRLNMLLAVLEKRIGIRLGNQDVFLNLAGGLRIEDPALDLAICASMVSSFHDYPIPSGICFSAEVGLGGEVRAIHKLESRIAEAQKLGFEKIIVSNYALQGVDLKKFDFQVLGFSKLEDVFTELFG
jgi:DNA repair protein RadA/Sms